MNQLIGLDSEYRHYKTNWYLSYVHPVAPEVEKDLNQFADAIGGRELTFFYPQLTFPLDRMPRSITAPNQPIVGIPAQLSLRQRRKDMIIHCKSAHGNTVVPYPFEGNDFVMVFDSHDSIEFVAIRKAVFLWSRTVGLALSAESRGSFFLGDWCFGFEERLARLGYPPLPFNYYGKASTYSRWCWYLSLMRKTL